MSATTPVLFLGPPDWLTEVGVLRSLGCLGSHSRAILIGQNYGQNGGRAGAGLEGTNTDGALD